MKNLGMSTGDGAYGNWTYVNLATGEHETHPDFGTWTYINTSTKKVTTEKKAGSLDDVKIKWDIAFRYNLLRTNNGATKLLSATEFNEVKTADMTNINVVDTVATGKDRVMVDFANMMKGILTYTSTMYATLCSLRCLRARDKCPTSPTKRNPMSWLCARKMVVISCSSSKDSPTTLAQTASTPSMPLL